MKLLVPVSGSKASLAAVRHAAAAMRNEGGEIILVNVQPRLPDYVARFTSRVARDAMRAERSAAALAGARAFLGAVDARYSVVAASGHIAVAVAEAARRSGADQIVLGTTRRAGWWQALFSPVPRIIDRAEVPVAVIGNGRSGVFERYGVPACVGLGLTALMIASE
jgi:nucleotide-binding universal stress UspA family protein